ncbi:MAG TPA: hypothetical protein VKQ72_02095 [Aggregatilineales bacterium]|nr:hypothetical protein [Aggregatilineales bacterium]
MQVKKGTVIYRHWDQQEGLNEIARSFKTLDDLFGLCLQSDERLLVERVIVEGLNEQGDHRTVTLVFQSISIEGAE